MSCPHMSQKVGPRNVCGRNRCGTSILNLSLRNCGRTFVTAQQNFMMYSLNHVQNNVPSFKSPFIFILLNSKYRIAETFWGENFHVLEKSTVFTEKTFTDCLLVPCPKMPRSQIYFAEKTFANSHKTMKFAKVFSLESFLLYGIPFYSFCKHFSSYTKSHLPLSFIRVISFFSQPAI